MNKPKQQFESASPYKSCGQTDIKRFAHLHFAQAIHLNSCTLAFKRFQPQTMAFFPVKGIPLRIFLLWACLNFSKMLYCQVPQIHFNPDNFSGEYLLALKKEFGNYKTIPPLFEKQILIALSYYPELKNTPIRFRIKHRHSILQTRSSWTGLFKRLAARDYVVTISDKTEALLTPLLFNNVSFDAQIGAMAHELAHVADFSGYSFMHTVIHGVRNTSPKYLDHFEFKTDSICIAHGAGYQLLSWSENVRKKMNTYNWRGPDYVHRVQNTERYMNPSTILRQIKANPLYPVGNN